MRQRGERLVKLQSIPQNAGVDAHRRRHSTVLHHLIKKRRRDANVCSGLHTREPAWRETGWQAVVAGRHLSFKRLPCADERGGAILSPSSLVAFLGFLSLVAVVPRERPPAPQCHGVPINAVAPLSMIARFFSPLNWQSRAYQGSARQMQEAGRISARYSRRARF